MKTKKYAFWGYMNYNETKEECIIVVYSNSQKSVKEYCKGNGITMRSKPWLY